jgi:hypothetical protein
LREIGDEVPLLDSPLSELIPLEIAANRMFGKRMDTATAASKSIFELNTKTRYAHRMPSVFGLTFDAWRTTWPSRLETHFGLQLHS